MGFYDEMAADLRELFDDADMPARDLVYSPSGGAGTPKPVRAVIEVFADGTGSAGMAGAERRETAIVHLLRAEVSAPAEGDVLRDPADDAAAAPWTISAIRSSNDAAWEVEVARKHARRLVASGQEADRMSGVAGGRVGR